MKKIAVRKPGTVRLDMISLFPEETWKNRPNGLRPDLAGMLADLKPGFVRFPGGCWVEGETLATSYRWKAQYGGLEVNQLRRLRQLEDENRQLKQVVADLTLDNRALKDITAKNW